ncbi:MAG: N-acetylmannosamine-6-phosphate 2-epimerase [Candidatus Melainabacteria bacterium]
MSLLDTLRQGVIVSVQASAGEPFDAPEYIGVMARAVMDGGARALRLANTATHNNIAHVKKLLPQAPVIGITKPDKIPADAASLVYITPTLADVLSLADNGAEVVAMDATQRERPGGESLTDIVTEARRRYPGLLLMADVATAAEGLAAAELGFDLLSTTLSGYTTETLSHPAAEADIPDYALMSELSELTGKPVILEGRLWEPAQVHKAFERGAYAVVIGSAITRPHMITQRFCLAAALPVPHSG